MGKHAPAAVTLQDEGVIREIRLGLGLRKTQLEKLKKAEAAAGIETDGTDERLKLSHDINGLFADDHVGTMFAATYPLKSSHEDAAIDPTKIKNEAALMAWMIGMMAAGDGDLLKDWRFLDKHGKLFTVKLNTSVTTTLAPRKVELVKDKPGIDEDRPKPESADKKKVAMAAAMIRAETALSISARGQTQAYMDELEGEDLDRFVDMWLDPEVALPQKPLAPDIWTPKNQRTPQAQDYADVLAEFLKEQDLSMTRVAMDMALAAQIPTKYLVEATGKGGKFTKPDMEAAALKQINEVGTQEDGGPMVLVGVKIPKSRGIHLVNPNGAEGTHWKERTMCDRSRSREKRVGLENGMEGVCKECQAIFKKGERADGTHGFTIEAQA